MKTNLLAGGEPSRFTAPAQDDLDRELQLLYSIPAFHSGSPNIKQHLGLWLLSFLICFGLGYQTLNRSDPRGILVDTRAYYEMVTGNWNPNFSEYSHRVLVPYLARPFYWMARGHVRTWNPVFLGLLVSNSLFFSAAVCLLVDIGCIVLGDRALALLGGMLYLLNFASGNFHLSGMVDSSQAFVMVGVIRTLLTEKWRWLVLWGLLGAFTKETSVPICVAFASGWWLASGYSDGFEWDKAFWIVATAAIGMAALFVLMFRVSIYLPLSFAKIQEGVIAPQYFYVTSALRCIVNHEVLYVFVWLLPLGLNRISAFPRPWVAASLAGVIASVAMGAYSDANGNTARPMFNAAGPLLSMSAALAIHRFMGQKRTAPVSSRMAEEVS